MKKIHNFATNVVPNTLNIAVLMKNILFNIIFFMFIIKAWSVYGITRVSKVDVVVIDAGHGGRDPGALGAKSVEKNITLSIAFKAGEYIKKNIRGVKVIYTRESDESVSLDERAEIANRNKADLFISIHANSLSRSDVYGTETYVMGINKTEDNLEVAKRENAVILLDENYRQRYAGFDPNAPESYILFSLTQGAYQESSLNFAYILENQFLTRVKRKSRGVKQAAFWVLWQTGMPSALVEVGYLTNKKEEKYLMSESGQNLIASAIYRAFKEYKRQIESVN